MGLAFFILAYVELFTGGAPLPGGPITEKRGALFSVWYPNWPLIGFYAWHGLLIAVLMTHILFRRDKQITSKKLLVVALCIAGAWYGLPSMLLR